MDKKGRINEYSEHKLSVYENYLIKYLSVLTNQKHYKNIVICEPFAGQGITQDSKSGSALISAKRINESLEQLLAKGVKGINIKLYLNDINKDYCNKLEDLLKDYLSFTEIYNKSADDFVRIFKKQYEHLNKPLGLIFIDPFGYKQISEKHLTELFSIQRMDVLLFMPTQHILRFAKTDPESVGLRPAWNFCIKMGIAEHELTDCKDIDQLHGLLKKSMKRHGRTEYAYDYKLEASRGNHCLFFITHHPTGAKKFLEVIDELGEKLLFPLSDPTANIKTFIRNYKTNKEIFEWGIKNGYLPKKINPILKNLEDKSELDVKTLERGLKRNKGTYYLRSDVKIEVKIKNDFKN